MAVFSNNDWVLDFKIFLGTESVADILLVAYIYIEGIKATIVVALAAFQEKILKSAPNHPHQPIVIFEIEYRGSVSVCLS